VPWKRRAAAGRQQREAIAQAGGYTKSGKAPSHAAGVKAAERVIDKALAPKKHRLRRPE
jgi:hypothetical protein